MATHRQLFLVTLVMIAFASNSILNRLAVGGQSVDAFSFGLIRLAAGALVLLILVPPKKEQFQLSQVFSWISALSLTVYIVGFSLAYQSLEGASGALILFFTVQICMLGFALSRGERFNLAQVLGIALACFGFGLLVLPGASFQPDWMIGMMMLAGIGWATFSLVGLKNEPPAIATRNAFLLAFLITIPLYLVYSTSGFVTLYGFLLAAICGAVTSGLGYWLWYRALKELTAASAAVWQLTVPVWVAAMGVIFLAEPLTVRFGFASVLVLGGLLFYLLSSNKSTGKP